MNDAPVLEYHSGADCDIVYIETSALMALKPCPVACSCILAHRTSLGRIVGVQFLTFRRASNNISKIIYIKVFRMYTSVLNTYKTHY